ncbi:hypothetical protein A3746_07630 [Oleibacter sp. HI0075]|nr:hypothetical protein A3746_07630 [Oleibacter sp. HI0075]
MGGDHLLRSEMRGFQEAPDEFLNALPDNAVPSSTRDAIRQRGSLVGYLRLKTDVIDSASSGSNGTLCFAAYPSLYHSIQYPLG